MPEQLRDYPTNHVGAIVDDEDTATACREAVTATGAGDLHVEVVHPEEEDQATTDPADAPTGTARTLLRKILGDESQSLERFASALRADKLLVFVELADPEEVGDEAHDADKRAVGAALTDAGAGEVTFFGRWQLEDLGTRS